MLQLRSLIFLNLVMLFSFSAFSAAGKFETSMEWNQVQGTRSNPLVSEHSLTSYQTQNFMMTSPTIQKNWTFAVQSQLTDNKGEIRDSAGVIQTLDSGYDPKTTLVGLNLGFANDIFNAEMSVAQTVSQSPISEKKYSLELNSHFLYSAAEVGYLIEHVYSDLPFNTYLDTVTFKNRQKPNHVSSNKNTLHYEQIFTENLKSRFELIYSNRNAERPAHFGAQIKNFYAFDNQKSLRFDLGFLSENQNESLPINQYGYYKMTWGELKYQHNLTYNWLIAPSYGIISEIENAPWVNSVTQLATDVYGLQMQYLASGWQANLKYEYSQSNNSAKSEQFIGGIVWEI